MIIDAPKEYRNELEAIIQAHDADFESLEEEHFFGDGQIVSMAIEAAPSVLNVVAASITAFAASKGIKIEIKSNHESE